MRKEEEIEIEGVEERDVLLNLRINDIRYGFKVSSGVIDCICKFIGICVVAGCKHYKGNYRKQDLKWL